ncbi:MAG: hypothetical protein KatS3mg118_0022 [Paracoccaceae bacterium]|nr:MAG: hypothetical protein KatS3mg118_0022 [Paracoccaceae bacterium]
MNWDIIKGKWTELMGKARETWGEITDDEWEQIRGARDQLIGKIQQRYGRSREEAEREVEEWRARL